MAISMTTGIFSGLDTGQIIEQLMAMERRPLEQLSQKKASYEAKISSYGSLSSALSSLRATLDSLKQDSIFSMSATTSDSSVFTVSASSSAAEGSYNIKVEDLAASQSLYSISFGSSSSKVADLSAVASQKIKVQVGSGTAAEITIDSSNNTLSGIRDAINNAGAGVRASVLKENDKFVIDSTNNVIVFNDGADRTATLAAGAYTADELAAAIDAALEAANDTNSPADSFSVSYDSTNSKFVITNNSGVSVNFLWGNTATTAEQILGFDPVTDTVASGSSTTADSTADGTYKLVLTSESTGASNTIKLLVDEDNDGTYEESTSERDGVGLSSLATNATFDANHNVTSGYSNMFQSQAAADASLVINGLAVTRSSNTIDDLITGVTINLLKDSSGNTLKLDVTKNIAQVTENINSFVSAYNSAVGLASSLSTVSEGQSVVLGGDSTARGIISTLRSTITRSFSGTTPSSLGLGHSKDGVLSLDTTRLEEAMNNDLQNVIDTFDAMATSLEDTLDNYINSVIPSRENGLSNSIDIIEDRMDNIERRLQKVELNYRQKFTLLEQTLGQLQQKSDFLTQQLDSLKDLAGGRKNA